MASKHLLWSLSLSRVWLIVTPGTVACQVLLSMEFSRQEFWSGLPFPSPGDLPNPGIKPTFPALASGFFTTREAGASVCGRIISHCLPVFLARESHGQKSLVGYSPWGLKESDTTEQLTPAIWASQVALMVKNLLVNAGDKSDEGLIPGSGRSPGVGNGNPLQYSCLENSMGRRAWRATVHGIAKSQD